MWKSTIKYYLTKNPLGCFIAILHWGIAYKAFSYLLGASGGEVGLTGLFFLLILDLPTLIPVAILLCPIAFLGSSETYFTLVCFVAFFTITFQWFVIGKKIANFFWMSETEKNKLSIVNNA